MTVYTLPFFDFGVILGACVAGWIRRTKCRTYCTATSPLRPESGLDPSVRGHKPVHKELSARKNPGHYFGGGAARLGEPSHPPLEQSGDIKLTHPPPF